MPAANIPWSKYTHIIHFAAAPGVDASGNGNGTVSLHYLTQAEINELIANRPAGKKAIVCIKDRDGYPNAFAQSTAPAMIATFVNNIVNFVNNNGYDGVDIDWESGVNTTQYNDLLARLRSALPSKIIMMAAGDWNGLPAVAAASSQRLDQINVMCYDMDLGDGYSWHNDALFQSGELDKRTCDWRIGAFTSRGVPKAKLGIGIPFYGRRWSGVTQPEVPGSFPTTTVEYRKLVTDTTRWQDANKRYDSTHRADYLSIAALNEFISYNGAQSIKDAVAWQKAQGFGGFMSFTLHYEYIAGASGDARYPLSSALYAEVSGSSPPPENSGPVRSAGSPTGTLSSSTTQVTLSLVTDVNATCKYATESGVAYVSMPYLFSVTGGTAHSTPVTNLSAGATYSYYVRCSDAYGHVNSTDFVISFSIAPPPALAPVLVSVSPASGSGSSQVFTLEVYDATGYGDVQQLDLVIDTQVGKANSCRLEVWAPTRTLFLKSDDDASWLQAALGSATTLQNSQCAVSAAGSSLSGSGNTLWLRLALTFTPAYAGAKSIIGFAADQGGLSSGWQTLGAWTVPDPISAEAPPTAAVYPTSGAGMSQTFTLQVTDINGAHTVQQADLFIGTQPVAPYSCWIEYWAPTKSLFLRSDDNTRWLQATVGSSAVLQNSQCRLKAAEVSITVGGNVLTVQLPVSFRKTTSSKPIFIFAADNTGRATGWVQAGTWTVK